jgi:antagonist of KipI
MSLKIIKAGILDTVQDSGRYGYQHQGINPGGAMDRLSAQLACALLGKNLQSPVLELHYPASRILFRKATIICITGACFSPVINGEALPNNQPVAVNENSVLQFKKAVTGARCYVSVLHDFKLNKWLDSYSTNLKAAAGGYEGRSLQNGDVLVYANDFELSPLLADKAFKILPWKAAPIKMSRPNEIDCLIGAEWNWLTAESRSLFQNGSYYISGSADRMGYLLRGEELKVKEQKQLVSSAVNFGTVQLLPNGQLMVLMADHQTTGGYPRIAHVLSADLPALAQMKTDEELVFRITDLKTAEQKLFQQQKYLQLLQNACKFKIENLR